MKYQNWAGFVLDKCAKENDFSHTDEPLYPFKDNDEYCIIEEFYRHVSLPEWIETSQEERRNIFCEKFSNEPLKEIKKYFDIAVIKPSEKIKIEHSTFYVEPNKQFVFREMTNSRCHKNALSFEIMFFVHFDIKIIWNYKVRKFIFDLLAGRPIENFNVCTPNIFDSYCEYFNFRNHEYKYLFAKIPVIRKLTGIKDTNWIIGFSVIYRLHLYKKFGNSYLQVYGL